MSTVIAGDAQDGSDSGSRAALERLVAGIDPWDELEAEQQAATAEWISTGASLYRADRPDAPATHLVSYFVVFDERRRELLLVAHRKAGLWLPTGGHVETGEHPWDTVVRECREELGVPAVPSTVSGVLPIFLTATETRGPHRHTDISLWFVLHADADSITSWDHAEFSAARWLSPQQALNEPLDTLDPHMHRFTRKLLATLAPAVAPLPVPAATEPA
jgi:8-oxo-dGTP pyrophosphatase MutT (NUDIX family)